MGVPTCQTVCCRTCALQCNPSVRIVWCLLCVFCGPLKCFSAKAREQKVSSKFLASGAQCKPLAQICQVCHRGSENCDQMYGSEMWGIVQGAYAPYALVTCSLTSLKPFSLSLEKDWHDPHRGGTSLQYLRTPVLPDLETHGPRVDSPGWYGFH